MSANDEKEELTRPEALRVAVISQLLDLWNSLPSDATFGELHEVMGFRSGEARTTRNIFKGRTVPKTKRAELLESHFERMGETRVAGLVAAVAELEALGGPWASALTTDAVNDLCLKAGVPAPPADMRKSPPPAPEGAPRLGSEAGFAAAGHGRHGSERPSTDSAVDTASAGALSAGLESNRGERRSQAAGPAASELPSAGETPSADSHHASVGRRLALFIAACAVTILAVMVVAVLIWPDGGDGTANTPAPQAQATPTPSTTGRTLTGVVPDRQTTSPQQRVAPQTDSRRAKSKTVKLGATSTRTTPVARSRNGAARSTQEDANVSTTPVAQQPTPTPTPVPVPTPTPTPSPEAPDNNGGGSSGTQEFESKGGEFR